jgi:hypothetical protein
MLRGRHRLRALPVACLAALLLSGALTAPAWGAKLIGGGRQAAIERAFKARHHNQLLVAVLGSTTSPGWTAVMSVRGAGGPVLRSYYHQVGGSVRPGGPPGPARADLSRDFKVAVVYSGSGSESINYTQLYRSGCAGAGGYTIQQTDTVGPMSWSVRYVVDLDHLAAAVDDSGEAALVPSITLAAGASRVSVTERDTRTSVDVGCNNAPSTITCVSRYGLSGTGAAALVTFVPGTGLEIGIPTRRSTSGSCNPDQFTLGPSLWAGGAAVAVVRGLGFAGGGLPANPYAARRVSWPVNSALTADGLSVSPCQGSVSGCIDSLQWRGTVRLQPVSGR